MTTARICGARGLSAAPSPGIGLSRLSLSALPAPAVEADLRPWCTYVDDQIGSECVGEGLSGAHAIATRGNSLRASRKGIYTAARARERLRQTDPTPDTGCIPWDAIDALLTVGTYPHDARDDDPAALNSMETWPEAAASRLFLPEHFQPIETGDTETIDRVLAAGFPVVDWMLVDQSFMTLGADGTWNGMQGPAIGGHCTVIVGKRSDGSYILWNSYGRFWGAGGFAYVARPVIAANAGLCAVLGGPIL